MPDRQLRTRRRVRLSSVLAVVVFAAAFVLVLYNLRRPDDPQRAERGIPETSRQAAEAQYRRAAEFRAEAARRPEQPSAGYATLSPQQQR